jgi:hypothetical protein
LAAVKSRWATSGEIEVGYVGGVKVNGQHGAKFVLMAFKQFGKHDGW